MVARAPTLPTPASGVVATATLARSIWGSTSKGYSPLGEARVAAMLQKPSSCNDQFV